MKKLAFIVLPCFLFQFGWLWWAFEDLTTAIYTTLATMLCAILYILYLWYVMKHIND